jgi:hypothetical protein
VFGAEKYAVSDQQPQQLAISAQGKKPTDRRPASFYVPPNNKETK